MIQILDEKKKDMRMHACALSVNCITIKRICVCMKSQNNIKTTRVDFGNMLVKMSYEKKKSYMPTLCNDF